MALSLRQKLTIVLLLLYWPTIFVLAHIPIPQLVYKARISDKTLHLVVYLILVFLLWFAVSPNRKVNWRRATVWWVFLVMAGYGGIDELLQGFVGRNCDIKDFLANFGGVTGGLILFSFLRFWPALIVVTGITIFCLTNLARANLAELLPITNAMFHLLAYAVFTMLWIRQILPLSSKTSMPKRMIIALAVPVGLLLVVKLFSLVSGRYFTAFDIIISCAGIAIAPVGYVFICSKSPHRIH